MYDCRELGFGIEIEFTRISRFEAAKAVAACLGTTATQSGGWGSDNYEVRDGQQRAWRIVKDNSITPQRMDNRTLQITSEDYQCELVSPKLTYDDLSLLQKLVRELRQAGAGTNNTTGIHVHVGAERFTPRSLRVLCSL